MKPIPVFVGYDPREAIAYHVCVNSIIRNSSQPLLRNTYRWIQSLYLYTLLGSLSL